MVGNRLSPRIGGASIRARLTARTKERADGQAQARDRACIVGSRRLRHVRRSDGVLDAGAAEGAARHDLYAAHRQRDPGAQRRRPAGSARPRGSRRPGGAGRRRHVHGQLRAAQEGGLGGDRRAHIGYRRSARRGARRPRRRPAHGAHRQSELRRRRQRRAGCAPVAPDRHRAHGLSRRRREHSRREAGSRLGDRSLAATA